MGNAMLSEQDIDMLAASEEQHFLASCSGLIHNPVKCVEKLKERYPEDKVGDIAGLLEQRNTARTKFSKAREMFFTGEGLEQSTSEEVSLFKSQQYFKGAECVDLCCGIGGTTIGMARDTASVTAQDIDPVHLKMAEYNVRLYFPQSGCTFVRGDTTADIPEGDVYHFDPSRRKGTKRAFDPEEYIPPLSTVDAILKKSPDVIVKVSPLFNIGESEECSVDIISFRGEVKEILLCYGRFNTQGTRAVILPEKMILEQNPQAEEQAGSDVKRYMYDPDPAVVKGGLTGECAKELSLSVIAPGIRYMTSDEYTESPMVKAFEVLEVFPFSYRHVNRYFKRNSIGNISVKCKDSFIKTGSITKKLKPKGKGSAALFYIEREGDDRMFIVASSL